ncbi:MAG: hypothetical protein HPY53_15100 [Brevinematales bacterium]|nr:hypothetical protein [Brevinematales bacterium]
MKFLCIAFSILQILILSSCNLPGNEQRIIPIYLSEPMSGGMQSSYGELLFTFSSPVFTISDYGTMIAQISNGIKIAFTPEVHGQWRPVDEKSAVFEFTAPLPNSTRFNIKVDTQTLEKSAGKKLSFTINGVPYNSGGYIFETKRIYIYNCYSLGEYTDSPIRLSFNQDVKLADVREQVSIYPISAPDQPIFFNAAYIVRTNIMESNNCLLYFIYTNKNEFILYPKGLTKATYYEVKIPQEFMAAEGNIGLEKEYAYKFNTYFPLVQYEYQSSDYDYDKKKSYYYPTSVIYIRFNNELDARAALSNMIKITPGIKGKNVEIYGTEIALTGYFKGEQTYKFEIDTGIKDIYGQNLQKSGEFQIRFEHAISHFKFPYGYMILENYLPTVLPMKTLNVEKFTFNHLYLSDMESFLTYLRKDSKLDTAKFDKNSKAKKVTVKWEWDTLYNYRFDLSPYKKGKSGILIYRAAPEKMKKGYADTDISQFGCILFTGLGVTVKSSPGYAYAFVRNLKDNTPVAGAKVFAVRWDGDTPVLNYCGKTADNGMLKFTNTYSETVPLVFAESDGGFTMNYGLGYSWDADFENRMDYYNDEYYNDQPGFVSQYGYGYVANRPELMLFSERYLYKPGDSVEIKGIFRDRKNDKWVSPSAKNLAVFKVKVLNSRNEQVTNFSIKIDDWGSFHSTIVLPQNAPTGYYSYVAQTDAEHIWSLSFRVEDYKPAQAEMKIIPAKDSFVWGERFETDVIGWYLFGAPVIKPVQYQIDVQPVSYSSKNFPDYSFSTVGWLGGNSHDYSFTLDSKIMFPDKDGKVKISKLLENQNFSGNGMISISASTVLDDKSTVYGFRYGIELNNPVQIGICSAKYFFDMGENAEIKLVALDENDHVKNGVPVTIEVTRYEWKSVQTVGVNGRLEWEWKELITNVYKQNDYIGQKSIGVKMDAPGLYIARVKTFVRGHQIISEDSFYVIGKGGYGWMTENNNEIKIETDKKDYEIGDTAKIMILNPVKNADVLLTIERDDIMDVKQFKSSDSMIIIPLKITEDFIPNMYVSVMLFSGRTDTNQFKDGADMGKPSYYLGYADLKVSLKKKSLKVVVKSDKDKYEPGDTAKITVEVKDSDGKPVEAETTLAIVDKGVLNLVNYTIPNPLYTFYSTRPLAIYTSEVANFIYGLRYLAEKGEIIGGDGGGKDQSTGKIVPRFDFKATAFYNDKLITKNGNAVTITFKVPDNLTAFKIMANAQTKDSKFGYGDNVFTVSKPLMILSGLPSFVRMGDSFDAGVTVYNYTGDTAKITLRCESPAAYTTNITLAQNGSQEVKFHYTIPYVDNPTSMDFTITASAGQYSDGIKLSLPVKAPKLYETVSIYKTTEKSAQETIKISENVIPEYSKLVFNLSPSAFSELKGSVDYMIGYPYGCLEQKCSKMLPLILGEDIILAQKLLDYKTKADLRKVVQDFINDDIPKYLAKTGFKYWADNTEYTDPYLTVYTAFVLVTARQKGYWVPEVLYNNAMSFTRELADGKGAFASQGWAYDEHYKLLVRSFAFYVSKLNGYENVSLLKQAVLKAQSDYKNDVSIYAFLLKTAAMYKDFAEKGDLIDTLSGGLMSKFKSDQSTAYFDDPSEWGWFYYSQVITTSIALQAILEAKIPFEYAHKVIRWLVLARNGDHWMTTHDNAMVFWAFSAYLGIYEKSDPNFSATAEMNKQKILETVFKSRNDPIITKEQPLNVSAPSELGITMKKSGAGLLYYYIKYQYMLKKYPDQVNAGFTVLKKYYDYDTGAEIKDNTFIRGKRYVVEIKVITPKERYFVAMDDSLPAGFEAVNLDFATEANEKGIAEDAQNHWWGTFDYNEKYFDHVVFFANYLKSGEHVIKYVVKASTTGKFQIPQTKAEEMYAPENFGYKNVPDITIIDVK